MTVSLASAHAPVVPPQQRASLDALRTALPGLVAEPHEDAYAAHATPWNVAVPLAPAAVVAVSTAQDVATAVRFARSAGMTVGVQATGHGAVASLAGHLLVSTKGLDEVTVHPEGWARIGAGVPWSKVVEAAAPHGLAPLNGSSSGVGVVGYLTGGGVGPMARTHGLASDKVRAFEVVTGDGVLRRVTPTEHADLFFALRGGKGAAGIVTAVETDLVPVAEFYGGAVFFDGADAPAVVAAWREWSARLPLEGTTSFALMNLPPLPHLPPPIAGRRTISVRLLWTGDPAEGARLLDEIRAVAPPVLDGASVKPYAAVDSVHTDPVDPMPVHESATLLHSFDADAADRLLALAGAESDSPQVICEIRQLGGAYAAEGEHPSAFDHRDAAFSLFAVGVAPDPRVAPHGAALLAGMQPWSTGGTWPNYAAPRDAATAAVAYAPSTLARLRSIAAAYDPDGVLAAGAFVRA